MTTYSRHDRYAWRHTLRRWRRIVNALLAVLVAAVVLLASPAPASAAPACPGGTPTPRGCHYVWRGLDCYWQMATEHENWVDWARQSAEAEIRDLRAEWQAAITRAQTAEARLRTAIETLRQIIEWSSDANYGAGMIDIERAARETLALIAGEVQP